MRRVMAAMMMVMVVCAGCSAATRVVFIAAEDEYRSEETLRSLGEEMAAEGWETTLLTGWPDQTAADNVPGLGALAGADLVVVYMRFRVLPAEQVAEIERYLRSGRPVIGLRTSTHAFAYPAGHELAWWNGFGERVLGAPWIRHFGHESRTEVEYAAGASGSELLAGVEPVFGVRSWLYDLEGRYPPAGARVLLVGHSCDAKGERVAGREPSAVAWTSRTPWGGRVFMTTLGHPEDFENGSFRVLMRNAMEWAVKGEER